MVISSLITGRTNAMYSVLLFGLWSSHFCKTVTKSKGGDALPKHLMFGWWSSLVELLPVAVADALPKHLMFGWWTSLVELLPVAGGFS